MLNLTVISMLIGYVAVVVLVIAYDQLEIRLESYTPHPALDLC
jgi:hypothetical protein